MLVYLLSLSAQLNFNYLLSNLSDLYFNYNVIGNAESFDLNEMNRVINRGHVICFQLSQ